MGIQGCGSYRSRGTPNPAYCTPCPTLPCPSSSTVWHGALVPVGAGQLRTRLAWPRRSGSPARVPQDWSPPSIRCCGARCRQWGAVETEKRTALPAPSPRAGNSGRGSRGSRALRRGLKGEPGRLCSPSSGDPRLQGRGRYFGAAAAVVPASPAKGSKFPGSELPPLVAVTSHPANPRRPEAGVVVVVLGIN